MKRILIVLLVVLSLLPASVRAQDDETPVRIIFMHHSTGANLIAQGGVREALTDMGYDFWDHGYNGDGLVNGAGEALGENWDVPGDNTDPDGWHEIFQQPVTTPPMNTFSHMLEFDVIIFKSCFPNSDIQSDEQWDTYQSYYLDIRDVIDRHPDKLFIAFTIPPLTPNSSSPEAATRARRWAEYLTSPEYLDGHPNLVVFDIFSLLADEDGYLRDDYRPDDESDSHPNELANQTLGPIFVDLIDQSIQTFVPNDAPQLANAAEEPTAATIESEGEWWSYENEGVNEFSCVSEEPNTLTITYDIHEAGSAGCGLDISEATGSGIQFRWHGEPADLVARVTLGLDDPTDDWQDATPFAVELQVPEGDFTEVTLTWDQFVKPDWYGEDGLDTFDPSQVVWVVFDVGYWESAQAGTLWIEGLSLVE
jgi:hypothetical protein